jgi:hypothetical protein
MQQQLRRVRVQLLALLQEVLGRPNLGLRRVLLLRPGS